MSDSLHQLHGERSARRFKVLGSKFKVLWTCASSRLCVSRPFSVETDGTRVTHPSNTHESEADHVGVKIN